MRAVETIAFQSLQTFNLLTIIVEFRLPLATFIVMGTKNLEAQIPLLESDEAVDDYADYKGYPHKPSKSGGWISASFILGAGSLERFAYYGIEANLISYLTGPLGESVASAAANVNTWIGVVSLVPVFGAILADSFMGRYRSIIISSSFYILGLSCLTLSTILTSFISISNFQSRDTEVRILFFVSLYLVALAQGYKPCVQAFGADQFDGKHPEESKTKSSFFNWWLCGLCTGATAAHLILHYIQDNINWGIGFGIPCLAMAVGLILFLMGNRTYRFAIRLDNEDEESPKKSICQPFVNSTDTLQSEDKRQGPSSMNAHQSSENHELFNEVLPAADDDAKNNCTISSKTKEAKSVLKLLPIWITCLTYTISYAQASTLFTKQASTVDRSLGPSFNIPAAAFRTFITLSILFFISMYDQIFVPIARKITRYPSGITMLQRIGIGMAISILNMVVAALIEKKRLKTAQDYGLVDIPNAVVPMSFWWLVPQYILFGLADVFNQVGIQEFFYDQVPTEFKSIGLSLYFGALGIGSFLSSFLISAIEKYTSQNGRYSWFCDNLNRAHIDYFYWFLAGVGALGLVVFAYFAKFYVNEENASEKNSQL